MNIALIYSDIERYWTVGSYIKRELSRQDEINIVAHPRIPEDVPIIEESNNLDIDLVLVIDCSVHYKLHHCNGKLSTKTRSAFWISDLHRPDWAKHRLQMIREFKYDHIFYAQKNFKQMILDCNYEEKNVHWLPHAADPEIFKPLPQITKRFDAGYIGFSNSSRDKFFNIVKQYCDFKHYNSAWGEFANRCLQELKICINIPVENDTCNMRSFESTIGGVPLLIQMNDKNGFDEMFKDDMYLSFSDESDLKEKLVRLITNSDLRKSMSEKARVHSLAHHTYRNRINTILAKTGFELLKNY